MHRSKCSFLLNAFFKKNNKIYSSQINKIYLSPFVKGFGVGLFETDRDL